MAATISCYASRLIRQHTTPPPAVDEIFDLIWDCKLLIQRQLIDYFRATVLHAPGITHLRRVADFTTTSQVRTRCHCATGLSPVCMGPALHLDLWLPYSGILECMRHTDKTGAVFPHDTGWSTRAERHSRALAVVAA